MKQVLKTSALMVALAGPLAADELADGIIDYMDFATYEAGIILPAQLTEEVFHSVYFVDTRDAEQFAEETIPGAVNIEWREIPSRLDELPETGMVVLVCNTGSLSAQAAFAARVMGRENVLVLQTGLRGWSSHAGYMPEGMAPNE